MIESSLIHKFSYSKKYTKRTKLLNKWLESHKRCKYKDYVKRKRLIKENLSKDVTSEDYESYGEEDFSIAHKQILDKSEIENNRPKISNNTDIVTSTPINVKKEKKCSFNHLDSLEINTKDINLESNIFQDKNDNINKKSFLDVHSADTVPIIEIKKSVSPTKKTQFIDNEEKRFVNTTDNDSVVAKKRKKSKKASLSQECNSSLMNGERTSQETLDLISDKEEITSYHSNSFVDNIKKKFANTTDTDSVVAKKRKKSKKSSLSQECNSSFMNGERTSQETLDLISDKEEITSYHSNSFVDNKEKRFVNTTDTDSVVAKKRKKSKKSSFSQECNSSFMNDERTSQETLDLISDKEEITSYHSNSFVDNEEKRFVNTTDNDSVVAKKRKKSKKSSLSQECNSSFMNGERTSQETLDLISDKEEITSCHSNTSPNNNNTFALETLRSPVIISSTNISNNNKYKIINKNEFCRNLFNEYNNASVKDDKEEELKENVILFKDSISSNNLSQYDKRINQIKNLDLAIDSSSSEDEHEQDLSKKTFLSNKNEIIDHKKNVNSSDNKITVCSKNVDSTTESTSNEDELLKGQNLNEKLNNSSSTTFEKRIRNRSKLKRSSNADDENDRSISNIRSNNNSINHNDNSIDHPNNNSKNCEQIQRFDSIPCSLQNLINKENLVHDSTKSTFTLEDLSQDNEIFLLNIPSTIKLTDLKGQKVVLKNEKLKLGKHQYRISYKDVPSQSCVFATHQNSNSYKLVNIKPTSSILVREKLSPSSFL
ncbi:PREDICTED: putative uncharacterized protein DDB_G0282133 isoform X1 [Polistes dominula]|uniref:Uncharacterized protein n=1 Tax=Polistes dominula TaxID=743375 RepID=A0ABM1I674_POLDO|nr:PREDICTED: putative uncharacterized protein DDB_G0282133 isoform X1 [Polistes dominula]